MRLGRTEKVFCDERERLLLVKILQSPLHLLCSGLFIATLLASSPVQASETRPVPNVAQVGAFIADVNPQLPHPMRRVYAKQTLAAARAAHIDPCLLLAVVSVESSWRADAISEHGAIGLGQLKATTAAELNANPYSVTENLRATSQYLHSLLARFSPARVSEPKNSHLAIAAYNAGPGAIARSLIARPNEVPGVTSEYVRRVVHVWELARAKFGVLAPPVPRIAHATPALDAIVAKVTGTDKRRPSDRPIQVSEEQTYWGMADTSASIAHSLFNSTPDAPNASVSR